VFARLFLAVAVLASTCLPASATELTEIPRRILKEPVYAGKPQYCLLVFGKEADTRVWLVLDGKTLYVDRNGNGDLTDVGEKLTNPQGPYFTIAGIVERDGTVHKNLQVCSSDKGQFSIELGVEGKRQQFVGIGKMDRPSWGDKPDNAPIIHFNGPMTLERYGPIYTVPRGGNYSGNRRYSLRLMLGTPGLGHGTFASYDEICSENLGPVQADIEYAAAPGKAPVKQRIDLEPDG
jgi:hypothetical protein